MSDSVSESIFAVASSSTSTRGLWAIARAKESSWRSPVEKVEPRSATIWFMPPGRRETKPSAQASVSASATSESEI